MKYFSRNSIIILVFSLCEGTFDCYSCASTILQNSNEFPRRDPLVFSDNCVEKPELYRIQKTLCYSSCIKKEFTYQQNDEPNYAVVRGCVDRLYGATGITHTECNEDTLAGYPAKTCYCQTSLCNSSNNIHLSLILIMFLGTSMFCVVMFGVYFVLFG